MIKSNPITEGWATTNQRTIIPKKFSHCCEGSEPYVRLSSLDFKLGIPRESDLKGQQDLIIGLPRDWGKETLLLEGTNKILCMPRPRRKGAVTPQETKPDLHAIKKAERRRINAFELWCWRRLLRVPWTVRRSNESILKEISPGCSLEGLMVKLKLQYFGYLM